jgi:uncharacterized membrane protein
VLQKKRTYLFYIYTLFFFLAPTTAIAQALQQESQETLRAEVFEIVRQYERNIPGTDAITMVQEVKAVLLGGERTGEVVRFKNDLITLGIGDVVFVNRIITTDGAESFNLKDIERRPHLLYLALLFAALTLVFAGWQGARALLSLFLSIGAILFLLVPALLSGYSPAAASLVISVIILAVMLFVTHKINPRSVIAFFGTVSAVVITCGIAAWSVSSMRLTGFGAEASVYLNFSVGGTLDLSGLLLGGIIIGLLGILDDVSITQASVVEELRAANPALGCKELYIRAVRVGRNHIGSLINTLAFAYVGAALPLVLFFAHTDATWLTTINQELVAAEIARIVIGSIGLVLAVPITTALAAWYFKDKTIKRRYDTHVHQIEPTL